MSAFEKTVIKEESPLWGPDRPVYTMEKPATYPTFNSITNNPTVGDERSFVRIGEIRPDKTQLLNSAEIVPGRQYLVSIYFHNDASSTYNDAAHDHSGIAVRTRMKSSFPTCLTADEQGTIMGTIIADNAVPSSVWSKVTITTKKERIRLTYVEGSAKIYCDWKANKSVIPSSLFSDEGALIGLNELNGVIPGCEQYHGTVTYVLQASLEEYKYLNDKEVIGKFVDELIAQKPFPASKGLNERQKARKQMMETLDEKIGLAIFSRFTRSQNEEFNHMLENPSTSEESYQAFFEKIGLNIETIMVETMTSFAAEYLEDRS